MQGFQGELDDALDIRGGTGRRVDWRCGAIPLADFVYLATFPDALGDFEDVVCEVCEFRVKALHGRVCELVREF